MARDNFAPKKSVTAIVAAKRIADLLSRQLGIEPVDSAAVKRLVENHWSVLSSCAHIIHHEAEHERMAREAYALNTLRPAASDIGSFDFLGRFFNV